MLATNLKVLAVVLGTLLLYTGIANSIPQVESEVPEELVLGADVTPEQLVAAGEELYQGAGTCVACHGLGTRAPNLLEDEGGTGAIGARCATRVPTMDCKAYLHQSLVAPTEHVVEGYQPIMPDMSRTLSDTQIWALVAYLQSVGGEVTVTAADIGAGDEPGATGTTGAQATAPAVAATGAAPGTRTTSLEPRMILREFGCMACHRLGTEGGAIGPSLDGVGGRLGADGIRHSILEPAADTSPGYEAVAGVMPPNFGERMSAAQLEALVSFLTTQKE